MGLPDSQSIRNRIRDIYQRGYVIGDDDARHPIAPISVASWRGEFVRNLCLAERATSSVEVGMAWGLSTLHIVEALLANGATGRTHVVIDPMQSTMFHNAARRTLRESSVDYMVEFHEAPSELVLPRLISEGRHFDFAFIDGDHRFEAAFLDVVFVDREARVLRVSAEVPAGRMRFAPGARGVLELRASVAARHGLVPGVRLPELAAALG